MSHYPLYSYNENTLFLFAHTFGRMHWSGEERQEWKKQVLKCVCVCMGGFARGRWGGLNVNCLITPISHSLLRSHTQNTMHKHRYTLLPPVSYVTSDYRGNGGGHTLACTLIPARGEVVCVIMSVWGYLCNGATCLVISLVTQPLNCPQTLDHVFFLFLFYLLLPSLFLHEISSYSVNNWDMLSVTSLNTFSKWWIGHTLQVFACLWLAWVRLCSIPKYQQSGDVPETYPMKVMWLVLKFKFTLYSPVHY